MKILKGCAIILFAFILICVVGYFSYKSFVISNLQSSIKNIEVNWVKFIDTVNERNTKLITENIENDSLLTYIKSSEKINKENFSRKFEYIEYKINQNLMSKNIETDFNEKLNMSVNGYNQSVREYYSFRSMFPNFIIAKKANFKQSFEYFDLVKYGNENQNPTEKRQKIYNWIQNGGEYPK